MVGLLLEMAERNEEREVGVLVAGRLEHAVEDTLHPLPEGVTPGTDHHATPHLGILGHLGTPDDLLVPLGKILPTLRGNRAFLAFAHKRVRLAGGARAIKQTSRTVLGIILIECLCLHCFLLQATRFFRSRCWHERLQRTLGHITFFIRVFFVKLPSIFQ